MCQSVATASPLLDSDSEGIEDIVAGREGGLQESESLGYRADDATDDLVGGSLEGQSKGRLPDRDEKQLSLPTRYVHV